MDRPVFSLLLIVIVTSCMFAAISSLIMVILAVRVLRKVDELEHNTNAIKDALIKVMGDEAYARGVKSVEDRQEKE